MSIVDMSKVKELYPKRQVNGHKGSYGRVVIIAGSDSYPGAPQLAAMAALRSGVGIATLMSTEKVARRVSITAPEAVVSELRSKDGHIAYCRENCSSIADQAKRADAILIGCGMGSSDDTGRLVEFLIKIAGCPLIIDADGINVLAGRIDCLRNAKAEILLTPHVGELARLCGVSTQEAIARRCELAKALTAKYGAVVMAKSASTVISSGDGMHLTLWGNDGLAKGGSGDTLAGITSSLIAQGMSVQDGAVLGASLLGLGCEMVSHRLTTRGMLASDITRNLPMLFKKIERLD